MNKRYEGIVICQTCNKLMNLVYCMSNEDRIRLNGTIFKFGKCIFSGLYKCPFCQRETKLTIMEKNQHE